MEDTRELKDVVIIEDRDKEYRLALGRQRYSKIKIGYSDGEIEPSEYIVNQQGIISHIERFRKLFLNGNNKIIIITRTKDINILYNTHYNDIEYIKNLYCGICATVSYVQNPLFDYYSVRENWEHWKSIMAERLVDRFFLHNQDSLSVT